MIEAADGDEGVGLGVVRPVGLPAEVKVGEGQQEPAVPLQRGRQRLIEVRPPIGGVQRHADAVERERSCQLAVTDLQRMVVQSVEQIHHLRDRITAAP